MWLFSLCSLCSGDPRPPLKKSLFPVHRVAMIVASREAAQSFFFKYILFLCIEMMWKMLKKKKIISKLWRKKMYPFGAYNLTRPVDRKQNYF